MFELKIGDIINTKNKHGWKKFFITGFVEYKDGSVWAILGKQWFVSENFGWCGERMWLIGSNDKSFWQESIWKKVH